jgi:1-acyl-sn-glycerol-3-phosphate acyltransferase
MNDASPDKPRSEFTKRQKWNKQAPLRKLYNIILRGLIHIFMRIRLHNVERMPATGGVILIINHVHAFDPFVVLPWFGRDVTPMAKVESFENPWTRLMVEPYGSIPVHRGELDLQAVRAAMEVINAGGIVLMSPEGTRSPTGALIRGQEGLAFLATRTKATIVPVGVIGTPHVVPQVFRLKRPTVDIVVGEPFQLKTEGKASREKLQQLTDDAMRRLAELLPEPMRGVYGGEMGEVRRQMSDGC